MSRTYAATLLISLGIVAGAAMGALAPPPARTPDVEWLAKPRHIPPFRLLTADGPFTEQQLRGKWHLLVFGYTRCPDICPTSLTELAGLIEASPSLPVTVVFVSVDPRDDGAEQLARYVHYFHRDFVGTTGSPRDLDSLADALGVRYQLPAPGSAKAIAHSTTLSLVGPDGVLQARLRPGFAIDATANELALRMGADG